MTVSRSHYELLGVMQNADIHNIKKAFHRLSKLLHPDTTSLPLDEAAREFQKVCEAYELLSDPIRREAYDDFLNKESLNTTNSQTEDSIGDFVFIKNTSSDTRRPLSGGELFSLLLLCVALFLSVILGIMFAVIDGKELQSNPSWLGTRYTAPARVFTLS